MNHLIVAVLAITLAGCAAHPRLYPVEGPYSKLSPPPVIHAEMSGMRHSGSISFALPDGPTCHGEWTSAPSTSLGVGLGAASGAMAIGTTGQAPGRAVIPCSDGRVVDLEFTITSVGSKSGVGAGKDNRGNVYRFML